MHQLQQGKPKNERHSHLLWSMHQGPKWAEKYGAGRRLPVIINALRESAVNHKNIRPRSRRCVPSSGAPDLTTREEVDLPVTITALLEHIRHKHLSLANERLIQAAKADIERKRAARESSKY